MLLTELKRKLGIESLQPSYLKDDKGERAIDPKTEQPTKWLRHWDDTNRRSIVMHEDTAVKLKANPLLSNLGLKEKGMQQPKDTTKPQYDLVVVTLYNEADFVF